MFSREARALSRLMCVLWSGGGCSRRAQERAWEIALSVRPVESKLGGTVKSMSSGVGFAAPYTELQEILPLARPYVSVSSSRASIDLLYE